MNMMIKNTICTRVVSTAVLFSAFLFLSGCKSPKVPIGPPLERVAEWNANPEYSYFDANTGMKWMKDKTPEAIIYTPENRWVNGLAGCMDPFMVDWKQSNVASFETGFVVVNNVLVGGNPILGTGRYATVKIKAHSIERIEYVIVRYHLKGVAKTSGHIQTRYVFKQDRRPELFDGDGNPDQAQPYLDDLMISWEAWRPTNTKWGFVKGLDPSQYALTARMFSGNQRFLNDSLRGAVWDCYPLALPDHPDAADTILYTSLIMGDTMARKKIGQMLNEEMTALSGKDYAAALNPEEKMQFMKRLDWNEIPKNWFKEILGDVDFSYHALKRSCISVALFQIELAMQRLYRDYDLGPRKEIDYVPQGDIPDWFNDLVEGNTRGEYLHAPHAAFWSMTHKEILPYKAYLPLKKADMIQKDEKGKIILYRYGHKIGSPYGELSRNLM